MKPPSSPGFPNPRPMRWLPRIDRQAARTLLRRAPWPFLAAGAVGLSLFGLNCARYPKFFFDDAFISLRYADRLRDGLGMTWTEGERVEGCTNFLWVAMLAVIGVFSEGLILPARALGVLFMGVGVAALVWTARGTGWRDSAGAWFAGLAAAALGPLAAWAVGGLEAPLMVAALGVALVFAYKLIERDSGGIRPAVGLGLALSVMSLTRPDGTLFTATFCVGLVLARGLRRITWRDAFIAGAMSSVSFAALSLFRRLYFGAWVPNTSFKLLAAGARIETGWTYIVRDHQLWSPLFLLLGLTLVFTVRSPQIRRRLALLVPSLLVWLAYVAFVGGDFMPQRRHLVPALFLLVAIAAEAIRHLVSVRGAPTTVAWYLAFATPASLAWLQHDDWAVKDANNSHWYWTGRPIGKFFRSAFGDKDPLLAVDAAGSLPYFSRFRSLDMLGLNDRYLATHPPKLTGSEGIGHELGDGDYVLERRPDLVVFHLPYGAEKPMFRSGKEMVKLPAWRQEYQLFYYRTREEAVEGVAHLRHQGGPFEPRWDGSRMRLPLWLLATSKTVRATLDEDGAMQLAIAKKGSASYRALRLAPSRCSVEIDATESIQLVVRVGTEDHVVKPETPVSLSVKSESTVTLEVKAKDKEGVLRQVEITCDKAPSSP
jgi:arabinofuranosyltransferase